MTHATNQRYLKTKTKTKRIVPNTTYQNQPKTKTTNNPKQKHNPMTWREWWWCDERAFGLQTVACSSRLELHNPTEGSAPRSLHCTATPPALLPSPCHPLPPPAPYPLLNIDFSSNSRSIGFKKRVDVRSAQPGIFWLREKWQSRILLVNPLYRAKRPKIYIFGHNSPRGEGKIVFLAVTKIQLNKALNQRFFWFYQ